MKLFSARKFQVDSAEPRLPLIAGSYRQARIAGDFLSSRKATRAERCPPKTPRVLGAAHG